MKILFLARTTVLCGSIVLLYSQTYADTDSIKAIQESTRKWTEIRMETVKLQEDWVWEKNILQNTKDALSQQLESMKAQKKLIEAETALARDDLDKAKSENVQLKKALIATEEYTQEMIERLKILLPQLPPRLSEALKLAYESLDDDEISLGEKQQLIVTICNRCTQFNNLVTYSEEKVDPDGADARVLQVIYLGLSQGYALDRSEKTVFYGYSDGEQWRWEEDRSLAGEIRQLIDVFKEEADPEIVAVPATIR